MKKTIAGFAILALALAYSAQRTTAQNALPTRLLQAGDLVHQGSFTFTNTTSTCWIGTEGWEYVQGAIAFNPTNQSLFMVGHGVCQQVAEFKIPALGGVASVLQGSKDVTDGRIGDINPQDPNSKAVAGLFVTGSTLVAAAVSTYDGGGTQSSSHFVRSTNFSSGNATGPFRVGDLNPAFYAGYFAPIPTAWQSALGGDTLNGQCCLSIISRTSFGPSVSAVNSADLVAARNPTPATMLVGYPEGHLTLGGGGVQSDVFSLTSQIRGVVLPNGTASVLFFGKHGTGPFCYGEVPTECTDPSNTYKGGHAYPYVPHVWAYNANDLAAVKAGKKRPWDVTPYAVWNLSDLGADIGGVAVDPATGRIFVIEIYGNGTMPRAHVYTISGASAPTADTTVPSVSISKPAAAATLTGTTTLAATATDNVGISSVWFTVDGTTVGPEVPTSPFQLTWDTTGVTNGSHVIRALARDAAGNVGQSAPVTVTVSNTTPQEPSVPTAIITAPAAGATVSGTVAVTATVSTAVAGVRFTLDGATLGAEDTSAPYTVSWATTGTANGSHTLRAIARNANGQTSTSGAVTITVNNAVADTSAPTVSLTAPASRARLTGTVTVSATASDNVGVAGVQFTLDGASLGAEDTSAPFTITWNTATAANGSHTLRAIARDAAGNTRTSSARTVSVTNTASDASAPTVAVTAPTANATVSKTVTLTASATDTVGVVGVQFAVDGLTVGAEDLTAPYSVAWNTALTTNGAHVITATARDAAGNRRTSSGVSVTVRNVGTDVVSDMNGDALPDLLFEHTNGQLYAWYLNGSTLSSSTSLSPGAVNPVWRVVSRDDFNGDKKADLLWQNTATGQVYLWYLDGATMIDDAWVLTDASPWQVATTADFNGDGKPDILWQQPATGQLAVWLMNGATMISSTTLTPGQWDPTWRVAGAADLNHDGKADLIWQNRATGALAYWLLQGLTATVVANFTPAATNLLWEIRAVADYNRDGQPDLLFQHAITGQMYVWYLTGTTMTGGAYLSPAQVQPDWRIVGGR